MRLPVVCVVLLIACIEVSRLQAEGTLAKVIYLLTIMKFFSRNFLKHFTVAVTRVAARVQWAPP